jgi:GSCFA family
MSTTPFQNLPSSAFWKLAVAQRVGLAMPDIWQAKHRLGSYSRIAALGSCFAQHISRALRARGLHCLDFEPAPADLSSVAASAQGYAMFAFRAGNIYTAAMLRQWLEWAIGVRPVDQEFWVGSASSTSLRNAVSGSSATAPRYFDPVRVSVPFDGFASLALAQEARRYSLHCLRQLLLQMTDFVFTLGLTEAWRNRHSGLVYASCPGTQAGEFDPDIHEFVNYRFAQVYDDLQNCLVMLRAVNPALRVLFTVSPVPLTATASGQHVLLASTQAKSVLRAVAGQLATEHDYVDYFPSYELISAAPFEGAHYLPNGRSVSGSGVAFVMQHFFQAQNLLHQGARQQDDALADTTLSVAPNQHATEALASDPYCDEAILDYYAQR